MTRKQLAIKKFLDTMTPMQQALIKEHILEEAFMEASSRMSESNIALLPTDRLSLVKNSAGIFQLMRWYAEATGQCWTRKDKDSDWRNGLQELNG